jgi:hypothetical protein
MFEDIRKNHGLTRQELANQTNRSVGYILKAEQATFPSVPIALLQYWVNHGYDSDSLRSSYRDFQRRSREAWLSSWEPVPYTAGLPFRHKWRKRSAAYITAQHTLFNEASAVGFVNERVNVYSSQYGISVGLCLPAAVVYRNEHNLQRSGAIVTCMEDLCEYVMSGRYRADYLGEEDLMEEETSIMRIAKEEGVRVSELSSTAA